MARHLQKELEKLRHLLLQLSANVEKSLSWAVKSVEDLDVELAEKVIEFDTEVDRLEIDVEEECLKILALHQPVALDLRFLVAVLKLNNDLERIGDLAVNIAERAIYLSKKTKAGEVAVDFSKMVALVQRMVKESMDALVRQDSSLARQIRREDDEVDDMHRGMYKTVRGLIRENSEKFDEYLPLLSVSRQLERIADHATNIAEDVIYLCEGEIVRHRMIGYEDDEVEDDGGFD